MADRHEAVVHFCNAGEEDLLVWLEPWAQEFRLPRRSELLLRCWAEGSKNHPTPELDVRGQAMTIYGAGGTRIAVFIDGVDRISFSAEHTAPDAGPLTTRGFVDLVFSGYPETRPAGIRPASRSDIVIFTRVTSRLARLWRRAFKR